MVAGLTLEVNIERQTKRRTKLIAAPESFPVYPKLESRDTTALVSKTSVSGQSNNTFQVKNLPIKYSIIHISAGP